MMFELFASGNLIVFIGQFRNKLNLSSNNKISKVLQTQFCFIVQKNDKLINSFLPVHS